MNCPRCRKLVRDVERDERRKDRLTTGAIYLALAACCGILIWVLSSVPCVLG